MRDRHHLATDGFVVVIVALDARGQIVAEPEILTRGFVAVDDSEELLTLARSRVREAIANNVPHGVVASRIKEVLADFLYRQTRRRPMVLPYVVEV
jgi:ribonuclease J